MRGRRRFGIASNKRLRVLLLVLVAVGSTGIWITLYATDLFRSLEGSTANTRFSIRGKQPAPKNEVVVAVDTNTFNDLRMQWPFPRAVDGQVISRIAAEHPAAIAFDVQLRRAEASASGVQRRRARAAERDQQCARQDGVLGHRACETETESSSSAPARAPRCCSRSDPVRASADSRSTPDGVIRRMEYSVSDLPTLSVVTAEVATHKRISTRRSAARGGSTSSAPAHSIPWLDFSQAYYGTYSGLPTGEHPLPSELLPGKDRRGRRHRQRTWGTSTPPRPMR